MREDNKNLLLAIVLSVGILIGWNYFYGVPTVERQRQPAATSQTAPGQNPQVPTPSPQ